MIVAQDAEQAASAKRILHTVREKLRSTLIELNALRNHTQAYFDTLQMAVSGRTITQHMIEKKGVKADEMQVLEALAVLVNQDRTLRGWHSSIGYGDGIDKWEWALPIELVGKK